MNEQEKQRIEAELRKIERRDGIITPPAVVEAARSPSSPLHRHFEWQDSEAAEKYRLWQARALVGVVLYQRAPDGLQRVYTSVVVETTTNGDTELTRCYVSTEKCLQDPALRQQILQQAIDEIERWRHKYCHLSELREVVKSIDRFSKQKLLKAA